MSAICAVGHAFSLAVTRSEIEARHRHRSVDRRLPGDYTVDRIFTLHRHPMVMHDPVDIDHDRRRGAGHGPTHGTLTYVGLVDFAWLISITRGGRPSRSRRASVVGHSGRRDVSRSRHPGRLTRNPSFDARARQRAGAREL